MTPNNGATYTAKVEECRGETPPILEELGDDSPEEGTTRDEDRTPVGRQYEKEAPGDVSKPKDVVPGTAVKKVPNTGGPPIFLGALVLLGAALRLGRLLAVAIRACNPE